MRPALRLSLLQVLDLEQCLCCQTKAPLPGAELCTDCDYAAQFIRPTGKVGVCGVCFEYADLYTSDYRSLDFAWCETHAVLETRRQLPLTDDHRGDIRNIAA